MSVACKQLPLTAFVFSLFISCHFSFDRSFLYKTRDILSNITNFTSLFPTKAHFHTATHHHVYIQTLLNISHNQLLVVIKSVALDLEAF